MSNLPDNDQEEMRKMHERIFQEEKYPVPLQTSSASGQETPLVAGKKPVDQVEQLWRKWSAAAIPDKAPLPQRAALKTAFMAGAATMLTTVLHTEEQIKIEGLVDEMVSYGQMLGLSEQPKLPAGNVVRLPKITGRRK